MNHSVRQLPALRSVSDAHPLSCLEGHKTSCVTCSLVATLLSKHLRSKDERDMFRSCGHAFAATALLLLTINVYRSQGEVTSPIKVGVPTSTVTGLSTCPSRSINYITQTLPQQCLTTSWASKPKAQETSTAESPSRSHRSGDAPSSTHDATMALPEMKGNTQPALSDLSIFSGSPTAAPSRQQGTASVPSASENTKHAETTYQVEQEAESESPLDNVKFLSFEEWKRQNLAIAGQSAEHLGTRTGGGAEQRRRPGGIHHALDSLGEDTEIEIDFGGFVDSSTSRTVQSPSNHGTGQLLQDEHSEDKLAEEQSAPRKRGKDAGKTCKERSNYASFDCASTVLKTNPECKGSTAVLVENKDSYMLNICSARNKFFIVELCDDILIDTIVLANFEFFSSMFRTFRVSVSDRYPVKLDKWRELGVFEARNSREVQAFLVENPLIWAKYLRVEFITHFGNEYYCPVSLLRVHGTTMMEEFNHDVKGSRNDDESDSEGGDVREGDSIDLVPADLVSADALKERAQETSEAADATPTGHSSSIRASPVDLPSSIPLNVSDATEFSSRGPLSSPGFTSYNVSVALQMVLLPASSHDVKLVCKPEDRPNDAVLSPPSSKNIGQTARIPEASSVVRTPSHTTFSNFENTTRLLESLKTVLPTGADKGAIQNQSELVRSSNQTSTSTVKAQPASTQPANPSPTTQESFFKSVHKRLQLLESNSTLSLQYIEEQSRILRDAFSKVEKRQLGKTTMFLETLNTTVLTELRDFRHQYDQIWQSTVLELSSQREQSQHEVVALSARLSLLADEIVFQKRMAIVQFGLILLCLGLIIFSRHGSQTNYLELPPVVHGVVNKSSASLSRYAHPFESPPNSPSSTGPSSRYGLFRGLAHRSSPSEESQLDDEGKNPSIEYAPPTPTSLPSSGDHRNETASDIDEHSSDCSPEPVEGPMRQTKSSPATPSGQRDEQRELGHRTLSPSEAAREELAR